MKKVLKFFLWINAAALFILNLSVSLNLVDINSIKLTLKQEQALADECGGGGGGEGCVFNKGDNIYGTHCWVKSVNGPAVHQWEFDTFWCTSTCPLGGSHCCYALEVRGPQ